MTMSEQVRSRELDALRGLAVLLMVVYHLAFDLDYFWGWTVLRSLGIGGWMLARTSVILFLLVAGICFAISWEHSLPKQRLQKALRRFLVLAGAAALVSFATWLIAPQNFVKFGILHLFALATLLLPLFAPLKHWNALPGILAILIPTVLTLPPLPTLPSLLAILLGSPPPTFSSLDYFPLLPWFGVILLGSALGHFIYIHHFHWRKNVTILNSEFLMLNSAGRHSLLIYLLHQPALLGVLSLLHMIFQTRAG